LIPIPRYKEAGNFIKVKYYPIAALSDSETFISSLPVKKGMVGKIDIPSFKVKYKDVFHLKNMYVMLHEYLTEEGFFGPGQKPGSQEGHVDVETMYMEKFVQKGLHQGGKEMWIWWRTYKKPETKYSGFYRYRLDFDVHVVYLTDIEVIHLGKKMKINSGEIEFFIRPYIEYDYDNKWEKHWLLKHVLKTYASRVFQHEFYKREKELWREAYRFQAKIKKYLQLRTFIPTPEPFHPAIYGYGE